MILNNQYLRLLIIMSFWGLDKQLITSVSIICCITFGQAGIIAIQGLFPTIVDKPELTMDYNEKDQSIRNQFIDESNNNFINSKTSKDGLVINENDYSNEFNPIKGFSSINQKIQSLTSTANFQSPSDVVFDSDGYLYVSDAGNHRVQKVNVSTSEVNVTWGTYGSGEGEFINPTAIAIDTYDNIYVADTNNHRIQKFFPNGTFQSSFGTQGTNNGQFSYPQGIAIDSSNNLYVTDTGNNRIQKFDTSGNHVISWGSYGISQGEFNAPRGVAVDSSNGVHIADNGNDRVQRFSDAGVYSNSWNVTSPWGIDIDTDSNIYVSRNLQSNIAVINSTGTIQLYIGTQGTDLGEYNNPRGLVIQGTEYLFVADTGNHRIQVARLRGRFITKWGSSGTDDGEFKYPRGIAINSTDHVYVTDNLNHRVQVFDGKGNFITKWGQQGSADGDFNSPYGIAINSTGYAYVADNLNHRVQVFDESGNFITSWGGQGSADGKFINPYGIAINSTGHVYVTDDVYRVQIFDGSGNFIAKWGTGGSGDGELSNPRGIAINSTGQVYVADRGNERVQVFDQSGNYLLKWGSSGSSDGQFDAPCGIAVNTAGYVHVIELFNHRVQVFDGSGNFITKWGSSGSGDGEFSEPNGMAFNSTGQVYVLDENNCRVQVFWSVEDAFSLVGRNSEPIGEFFIEWSNTYGGSFPDNGRSGIQTVDGGFALAGDTSNGDNDDMWLVKTDANGVAQWNKTYGGVDHDTAWSMIQTADEGFALAGYTTSYGTGGDMWLVKTDVNGVAQWNKTYGEDRAKTVIQTADGGFALAGDTTSSGTGVDMWLVKTDATGVAQWNKTYGGTVTDYCYSMIQTADGGFALVGRTDSYGDSNYDMWLVKTDVNGVAQWNKTYGGTASEYGFSVIQTSDSGFALAGLTDSFGAGNYDTWLVKTDANGIAQWNKTFGGINEDVARSVIQTADGGFVLAGETDSYGAGNDDMWLVKTDVIGVTQWNKTFGGIADDMAWSVIQTSDEKFVLAGNIGSDMCLVMIFYDEVFPTISLPNIQNHTVIFPAATIDLRVEDDFTLDQCWFNWDGGSNQSLDDPWKVVAPSGEGYHWLTVYANDSVGHLIIKQYRWWVNHFPSITLFSPENNTIQEAGVLIQLQIEDLNLDTAWYHWDDGDNQSFAVQWTIDFSLADGWHVLTVHANDTDGALTSINYRYYSEVDTPSIDLVSIVNNTVITIGTLIMLSVSDFTLDQCWFNWDDGSNLTLNDPWEVTAPSDEGYHWLMVHANDSIGHLTVKMYYWWINKPPVITLLSSTNNTVQVPGTVIELQIDDLNLDTTWYQWDNGGNQSFAVQWTIDFSLADGWHELAIHANDTNGALTTVTCLYYSEVDSPSIDLVNTVNDTVIINGTTLLLTINDFTLNNSWFNWDGESNLTLNDPWEVTAPSEEGYHWLTVHANDSVGHLTVKKYRWWINHAPTVTLLSPVNNTVHVPGTAIKLQIEDNNLYAAWYQWNNDINQSFVTQWMIDFSLADGWHVLTIHVNDTHGALTTISYLFYSEADFPIITLENMTNDTIIDVDTVVQLNVTDFSLVHVWFSWDYAGNQSLSSPWNVTSPSNEGYHWLTVHANDSVGHLTSKRYRWWFNSPPIITLLSPEANSYCIDKTVIVLYITDSSPVDAWYQWDSTTSQNLIAPYNISISGSGWRSLTITAVDEHGATTVQTYQFYVLVTSNIQTNQSPPTTAYSGESFLYSFTITNDDSVPLNLTLLVFGNDDDVFQGNGSQFILAPGQSHEIEIVIQPKHASVHQLLLSLYQGDQLYSQFTLEFNVDPQWMSPKAIFTLLIIMLVILVIIVVTIALAHFIFKRYMKLQEARKHGFGSIKEWKRAGEVNAFNPEELAAIELGDFSNREEWLAAKERGFETRSIWLNFQRSGAESPAELQAILDGRFNNRDTWLEANKRGFTESPEWEKAQRVNARSPEELAAIEKGGFKNRDEWLAAKESGFSTSISWKKAQRVKAQSPEELSTIEKGDFKSRDTWLAAQKRGFTTASDWKKAKRVKARIPEELSAIEKGEFKDRSEWLAARKAGVNTIREYQEYLNLQKVQEVLLKLRPNIQVQLSRIASLAGFQEDKVENILESISKDKEIGEYLSIEQVFIRSSPEDSLLEKAFEEWAEAEKDKRGKK
jgi:hypothetical protein